MSTYSLRKLSNRVKNAHIRVTDIGWQFADDLTADESKSLAYIATLLSGPIRAYHETHGRGSRP